MAPSPGVLTHQEILRLCGLPPAGGKQEEGGEAGPIHSCLRRNVRSASYDLRLGPEFHFSVPPDPEAGVAGLPVTKLEEKLNENIVIPPNDVVVVSSLEKVCLDDDLVAHLSLKQDILLQGLIMASQSQIDAGYEGWIYALLYNLTDGDVTLKLGESILRLELVRLPEATTRPYEGHFQNAPLSKALIRPIGSSLQDLRRNVERRGRQVDEARDSMEKSLDEERRRISRTQLIGGFLVGVLTVLAIALPFATGFVNEVRDAREGVNQLEEEVGSRAQVSELRREVAPLVKRVVALECRLGHETSAPLPARC